jgi:catechol 2,3-dioxygenase-like lactoylglutathione lyase family enzyme
MINGAHVIVYSKDAESDRAFFRDVLKFPAVDAGHGWLIFALPPAEAAFHPAEKNDCARAVLHVRRPEGDDGVAKGKKVKCGPVKEERWGSLTTITLPGGGKVGLYQPKHPTAIKV